ncbi:MAG: hypothetical protein Q8L23_06165 [Caulobacter sp.]|nr:hypothetical protein [Caulobacter sp.]
MSRTRILPACAALALGLLAAVPASTAGELIGVAVARPAEFRTAPKPGDPLADVGVSLALNGLAGDDSRAVLSARTNADGEAVFSNLRAGEFTITVTPVNDAPTAKLNRIGGVIIISGTPPKAAAFSWARGRKSFGADRAGHRIVIPVARDGGEVRVRLTIFDRWGK